MKRETPTVHPLWRLWSQLTLRRKRQFLQLLCLMVLASFAEIISLGAVLPFLAALTAPDKVVTHPLAHYFFKLIGVKDSAGVFLPMTLLFAGAVLFAGTVRLLLLWVSTRFSLATGADLSFRAYENVLHQPYEQHVMRNSSEVIAVVALKSNTVIFKIIQPVLNLFSSVVIAVAILAALVAINPYVAAATLGGFGAIYGFIVYFVRRRVLGDGQRISQESTRVFKIISEGLGGIRDVLIDGTQRDCLSSYRSADSPLRKAQGDSTLMSQAPRYLTESLGMLFIAGLAFLMAMQSDELSEVVPVLGAFALGAQRLLPILQQAYSSWSHLQVGRASLNDLLELLEIQTTGIPAADVPTLLFQREIVLDKVCFSYASRRDPVIDGISLSIPCGSVVGFVGRTGSGKSTLMDLIMGLLTPSAGTMSVDGVAIVPENRYGWQRHIAHVPQSIFLADRSVADNIALGIRNAAPNPARLVDAAKHAQFDEVVKQLPDNYETLIGEAGVRLSGGQRQRLGIARALYKQTDVLVLDEATSALDDSTERALIQSIHGLDRKVTVFMVAHRLETLRHCDLIVELEQGKVSWTGSYAELMKRKRHDEYV